MLVEQSVVQDEVQVKLPEGVLNEEYNTITIEKLIEPEEGDLATITIEIVG